MPVVEVTMFEGRDEEAKARIARGIAELIAENGYLPVDAVHVIFNEKRRDSWARGLSLASRREPSVQPPRRVEFACISELECSPESEREYMRLRRDEIDPAMAGMPGFVSASLFRSHESPEKYVLITKWMSKEDFEKYGASTAHGDMRQKSVDLLSRRPPPEFYEVVHVQDERP
jgi:phenylpyruvate tautomerase PptA (4-oxalocrotonate tautomerase family)/heme-degrading monooxygenase HmoA